MPGDPRWLNPEERDVWLDWVFATRLLWEELERDLHRDAHMPFGYYEILVMLSDAPDRAMRMSDLAGATQSSRSRLSHAVARLEESGWVRREGVPGDRRGAVAVLTDEGFSVLACAAPLHVESVRTHLFDQLTDEELEQLHAINTKLLAHLLPLAGSRGDPRPQMIERARTSGAASEPHA